MDLETATDAVDATFDAFGHDAAFGDLNASTPNCQIIPWRASKDRPLPGMVLDGYNIAENALYILVRAAEVADPGPLDAFLDMDGPQPVIYRIGESAPIKHDIHGIVWRCQAVVERGA